MTTAKSSFSMKRFLPVYKNFLRHYRGSAIFYGILGFLFFGLQYVFALLEYMNMAKTRMNFSEFQLIGPANIYNGFAVAFFTSMTLIVPLVLATNMFGYMQNKRSVDVYHSLPLSRSELYLATSAAGMTLIWIPLIANFLFVAGCSFLVPRQSLYMIFLELICWMIITFVIFAVTSFAAVNVGTSFDTSIFSMGLLGSIAAIHLVVISISSAFLYGYKGTDDIFYVSYRLSPVSVMLGRQALDGVNSASRLAENNIAIAIWLVAGIAIFFFGMIIYKKRSSEQAESVGTLGPLQIFLRSVGTLVGGNLLGAVFCGVFGYEESKLIFIIAVAIGSLITYFIGDVILTRTVRSIPKALPVALATTLAVCLLVGGIMYGGFGYQTKVPSNDSIETVSLESYNSRYSDEPTLDKKYTNEYIFSDPDAVKLILAAHEAQVQGHISNEKIPDEDRLDFNGWLDINYALKNGKTMSREYYGIYPNAMEQLLMLECEPEMIRQTHAAFKATADMITSVSVTNALGNSTKELTLDSDQKQQLLEAVRQDLLSQPIEELKNGTQALGYLRMEYKYADDGKDSVVSTRYAMGVEMESKYENSSEYESQYSVVTSEVLVTESFKNTRALLKQFGAEEQLQNDFSTVKKAYIGIVGYHFLNSGTIVHQTSFDGLQNLNNEVLDAYYDYDKDDFISNGEVSDSYLEIDFSQLTAIRKDLTSVYNSCINKPYVVVCIENYHNGEDAISGYYFMPFEVLSDEMKYEVCEKALDEYGRNSLVSMGYDYFK